MSNTPISLNGDVLRFDYSNLAALTGFANTASAFAVAPIGTNGSTINATGLVSGAGGQIANLATAQFLYNQSNGALSFDADGTGVGLPTSVGTINTVAVTLTATDFLLIA